MIPVVSHIGTYYVTRRAVQLTSPELKLQHDFLCEDNSLTFVHVWFGTAPLHTKSHPA
jgi:hypothetical protein